MPCKRPSWSARAPASGSAIPIRGRPDPEAIVAYDPGTGRLTALRAGTTELVITVNGVTARKTILVD